MSRAEWEPGPCGRGTRDGRTCRMRTPRVMQAADGTLRRCCRRHLRQAFRLGERELSPDEVAVHAVMLS